jgi:tRNA threonylcarbamoyladenosine biosynthesis protein TsaE
MGVGKTTLIKAICSELQVVDTVTSPTFALVNEYRTRAGQSICHFDLYRIDDIAEVYDLGYEEYFYSGSLCLIEWPEIIEKLLPDKVLRLQIRVLNDGRREITIIEK